MTVLDFLGQHNIGLADLHNCLSDCHSRESERYEKAGMKAESDHHREMASAHKSFAAKCARTARQIQESAKATQPEVTKRMPSDRFSSVAFADAPKSAFGITAVPRAGAPAISQSDLEKVDERFQHLISSMDDDLRSIS